MVYHGVHFRNVSCNDAGVHLGQSVNEDWRKLTPLQSLAEQKMLSFQITVNVNSTGRLTPATASARRSGCWWGVPAPPSPSSAGVSDNQTRF